MPFFRSVVPVVLCASAIFLGMGAAPVAENVDTKDMDRSIKPGDDFYRYANSGWLKTQTIPAGQSGFDYWWQLSPDGSLIGIVKRHGHEIRLVPLRGGQTRTIVVTGYPDLLDLNWAMDSHFMYVSTLEPGVTSLLRVDLNGHAQPIWHQPQATFTWGYPSPDGRHLAIMGASTEANVWVINNF